MMILVAVTLSFECVGNAFDFDKYDTGCVHCMRYSFFLK